jgi:hypothetical protein
MLMALIQANKKIKQYKDVLVSYAARQSKEVHGGNKVKYKTASKSSRFCFDFLLFLQIVHEALNSCNFLPPPLAADWLLSFIFENVTSLATSQAYLKVVQGH